MLKLLSLLMLTWHVLAEVPTDEDRKAIVECHTKLCEHVDPPASNMFLVIYLIEMENFAVKFFAACRPLSTREPFQGTIKLLMQGLLEKSHRMLLHADLNLKDQWYEAYDKGVLALFDLVPFVTQVLRGAQADIASRPPSP
uniref:Secreted protein n=1 Tax=Mesocestoides corti TaxID=53468 RepID=A0A5K3FPG8_MESCO